MIRSIGSIIIRLSYIAALCLAWLDRKPTAGFSSTRLPLCQSPLILGQEMLSHSVSNPIHLLCLAKKKIHISIWYSRTRRIMFASHISSNGNGNQTNLENNESFDRPKSLFHAGGRGRKNVGKGKKKPTGIRPFAFVATTLTLVAFALMRLFANFISGTPNYVYYTRSVKESTTITSSGKVIRKREEDFRSNIPGLSSENFNSRPEVPSHDRELNSPYLNSMRLQQEGLERVMEQQLDMQEEMSAMMESFWR